jgi:hypothetical protein
MSGISTPQTGMILSKLVVTSLKLLIVMTIRELWKEIGRQTIQAEELQPLGWEAHQFFNNFSGREDL